MKALIVDDDFICQTLLNELLSPYGPCAVAGSGPEALTLFEKAHDQGEPYDLVCLDIMMPDMDGHEVLQCIRKIEKERKVEAGRLSKIIMTTALSDPKNIMKAFLDGQCEAYLSKPIKQQELINQCRKLGLIE